MSGSAVTAVSTHATRELHGPEYWEQMGQQEVTFHEGVVAMAEQVITGEDLFSVNVGYRVVVESDGSISVYREDC